MLFKNWKKEAKEWKGAAVALNKALESEVKERQHSDVVLANLSEHDTLMTGNFYALNEACFYLLDEMTGPDMEKYKKHLAKIEEIINEYPSMR